MHRRTPSAALAFCLMISAPLAAQEWVQARLEGSPRHLEWIEVENGDRTLECFIAYPEVADKAHAVVVIHEIFGLSDWVRGVADQLAEQGYIAIAPDLLSGMGPDGGGTASMGGGDQVRRAIRGLEDTQVLSDLDAAAKYVTELPACDGTVSVGGFCWGGSRTFRYATHNPDLKAACVFYGSGPDDAVLIANIRCPVYGFYGENDNRVNSTIDQSKELMADANKTYIPVIYDGAGHGFMRAGEDPNGSPENQAAREKAWERWLGILGK